MSDAGRSQTPLRDSRKPWCLMFFDAGGTVMHRQHEYFWTRWGARRRQQALGNSHLWRSKVVSNR